MRLGAQQIGYLTACLPHAPVTIRITKDLLLGLVTGSAGIREVAFSDDLDIEGSRLDLVRFFWLLDTPVAAFPIVTP